MAAHSFVQIKCIASSGTIKQTMYTQATQSLGGDLLQVCKSNSGSSSLRQSETMGYEYCHR